MLQHVIDVLADPIDGSALCGADEFSRLVSTTGHSYDVAKQGYVTLASGAGSVSYTHLTLPTICSV